MSITKFNLFIFVIFVLVISSCSMGSNTEVPTPTPLPTPIVPRKPTYEVDTGEVVSKLQFTGRVSPVSEQSLFFRADGRVRNAYSKKGDQVRLGQVLADLDFLDDLERQLALDKLGLRRAQINLENANLQLQIFEMSKPNLDLQKALALQALASAEKSLSEANRGYINLFSTANQADIDAAYAKIILTQNAYDKAKEKFAPYANKPESNVTRAILQSQLSSAQKAYESAELIYNSLTSGGNDIEKLEAEAELSVAQANLKIAQDEWDRVQNDPTPDGFEQDYKMLSNSVELAQIALEETEFGMQDLESDIADAQIVSPIEGEIVSLSLSEGRTVEAFKPVVVVANYDNLEVSANLNSQELTDLEEGMSVSLELNNSPGEIFTGFIRRLPFPYGSGSTSSAVEDIDTSTRISFANQDDSKVFEPGDLIRVTVILAVRENVLWLPPQAIRTFEGRKFVVIQEGEFQQRVDIKLGIEGDDRVEIIEGLEKGQIVIGP